LPSRGRGPQRRVPRRPRPRRHGRRRVPPPVSPKRGASPPAAASPCTTVVTDLTAFAVTPNHWSAIVAIFAHLPPPLRRATFAAAVAGLRPGGVFLLEAYTPAQLAHGTGGPKDPTLLMSLTDLRTELSGLTLELGQEIERDVIEGHGHTGRAAVVQIVARKH